MNAPEKRRSWRGSLTKKTIEGADSLHGDPLDEERKRRPYEKIPHQKKRGSRLDRTWRAGQISSRKNMLFGRGKKIWERRTASEMQKVT